MFSSLHPNHKITLQIAFNVFVALHPFWQESWLQRATLYLRVKGLAEFLLLPVMDYSRFQIAVNIKQIHVLYDLNNNCKLTEPSWKADLFREQCMSIEKVFLLFSISVQ